MDALIDAVRKNHKSGFVFADINNDLGDWCSGMDSQPNIVKMAYVTRDELLLTHCMHKGL